MIEEHHHIEERRKEQRAKRQLPLKIAERSFDIITETVNISPSGTYCRVTRLLPLMSKIEVVIIVPTKNNGRHTKKIKCKGVVVRTEPVILKDTEKAHYNVGIFFTDISKKDRELITSYLDSKTIDELEIQISN